MTDFRLLVTKKHEFKCKENTKLLALLEFSNCQNFDATTKTGDFLIDSFFTFLMIFFWDFGGWNQNCSYGEKRVNSFLLALHGTIEPPRFDALVLETFFYAKLIFFLQLFDWDIDDRN